MTKKQGLALPPGIYKIHWKSGGWSWGVLGETVNLLKTGRHGWPKMAGIEREIMCCNWSGSLPGSRMWRKIARVERAKLEKMEGEQ